MSTRSIYLSLMRRWQYRGGEEPAPDHLGELFSGRQYTDESSQTIGIIGGGISGLTAAVVLERLGHRPVLFEADSRLGGRVHTLRDIFDPPLFVEAGAARIRDDHFWTLAACQELDLKLIPFYPPDVMLVRSDGNGITRRKGSFDSAQVHQAVTAPFSMNGSALPDDDRPAGVMGNWTAESWWTIDGGMDQLPLALAGNLDSPVHLKTKVTRITQGNNAIELGVESRDRRFTCSVDRVICTVPFSVIADIEFDPPLPEHKQRLVSRLPYTSANRFFAQFARRSGLHGAPPVYGASAELGEIWQPCHDHASACLLVSYLFGERARLRAERFENLRGATVEQLAAVLGVPNSEAVRTCWYSWDDQPFARGAQSRVWDLVDVDFHQIRSPHGDIRFAGEHTASIRGLGWIDGAVESGVREALSVHHQAVGK